MVNSSLASAEHINNKCDQNHSEDTQNTLSFYICFSSISSFVLPKTTSSFFLCFPFLLFPFPLLPSSPFRPYFLSKIFYFLLLYFYFSSFLLIIYDFCFLKVFLYMLLQFIIYTFLLYL